MSSDALVQKIRTRFLRAAPLAIRDVDEGRIPPALRLPEGEMEVHVRLSIPDWKAAKKIGMNALGIKLLSVTFIPREGTKSAKAIFRCHRTEVERLVGRERT